MRVCLAEYMPMLKGEQRPTSFAVEPRSGNILFSLERCRPSEADKAFQGRWTIASEIKNGKPLNDKEMHWKTWGFWENSAFSGDFNNRLDMSDRISRTGKFFIDATKQPKRITLLPNGTPLNGAKDSPPSTNSTASD